MCTDLRAPSRFSRRFRLQAGLTLIELIMFIVIVGIGLAGILSVLNLTAQKSADPMVRKQMLAAAESLLEEVELMPFTYCDPTDANFLTAANPAGCTMPEGTTTIPAGGESRGSVTTPFNNVGDYGGTTGTLTISPLTDISNGAIFMLAGYSATVNIATSALGGIAATESLLITVTVTASTGESLALSGYRTRYAPYSSQ
jgi:MSHA pilin protein MshD